MALTPQELVPEFDGDGSGKWLVRPQRNSEARFGFRRIGALGGCVTPATERFQCVGPIAVERRVVRVALAGNLEAAHRLFRIAKRKIRTRHSDMRGPIARISVEPGRVAPSAP